VGEFFPKAKLTVIGFVVRSVTFDQTYHWFEYLLYEPKIGFRWLVQSDDHWSYVKSVPLGEVSEGAKTAPIRASIQDLSGCHGYGPVCHRRILLEGCRR